MANSYECETKLTELAQELYASAGALKRAVECLRTIREHNGLKDRVKLAKEYAKQVIEDEIK